MSKKNIFLIGFLILIIILSFLGYRACYNKKVEKKFPILTLNGPKIVTIEMGEVYEEQGYTAIDPLDGDITEEVVTENNIDYSTPGTYQITYQITNSSGIKIKEKRFITIILKESLLWKTDYNNIDNKARTWWSNNKKDQVRPSGGYAEEDLKIYNAYYQGPDEKVIYLTFDEGMIDTYVNEIVDVLNKYDVKGTFFLCKGFITANPDLMKKMVETGHSVGNHTANHKHMPTLATEVNFSKYLNEIKAVEEAFYKITGKQMDKVYREPKGEWSFRSLQIVKDLGYKTYFWSADYMDFAENVSKETALNNWLKRYHNGAIYLIHPKNKGNYQALGSFIEKMRELGYRFDLVKNIG